MAGVVRMPRSRASALLDDIRKAHANCKTSGAFYDTFTRLMKANNIEPLEPCKGEAHSNAYIDNCGVCMPRWGLVGPFIKIA